MRPANSGNPGVVPVEVVREAMERVGLTPGELAVRLGWSDRNGRPDVSRVRRALGLADITQKSPGSAKRNKTVRYETAVKMAEALGYYPVDWGL